MIGEILGNRYEIVEQIGEGGMSIVYKARCNKLDRFVAVKILKNKLCDNADIVTKFKREATAIATLSDNNIVNVLDVGTQDNINYIVMEYVKGKTLKEVIREFGKLNYETTIKISTQIAKALDCAHKNKIIHRDIKPQNILVTEEGLIKVTDFGIAKLATSETLTNTTTIMGSAQYFSPEQAKGSIIDVRTDIYSLGVVIYEMATGKLPFEADSPVSIALKHIQEEPVPPKQINSRIPDSLNKLILKAMEKDANKRYQTAKEIINDLQKIKEDPNAIIIGKSEQPDDGHTMVMAAVNLPSDNIPINKDLDEDYDDEDDDYYDDEDDDEEKRRKPKKKKKKSNKNLIIGIIIAIVLLIAGVGAYSALGGGALTEKDAIIPDLNGMTLAEAKSALEGVGLVLEDGGTEESDQPEGAVLQFSPEAGSTVKSGSKVRVIISGGVTKIKMQDLRETSLADAKKVLDKDGLTNYTSIEKNDDVIKTGYVISTDPEAGSEITVDSKITIYVSKGPATKYVSVPGLMGLTRDEAIATLTSGKLKYNTPVEGVTTEESKNGTVINVSHQQGIQVAENTPITITIGKYTAPVEKTVDVDDLDLEKGMTKEEAISAFKDSGLVYSENGEKGVLESWTPNKGELKEGSSIALKFKVVTTPTTPTKDKDDK
ncbi:Stk1 family PASTA domain-containing Ser/Thr kinase [Clostridium vincentii]|uniref:non-specific serine/threonine protein kinase n=1 Tax=Clostridium vincentii TaxID=52704 RepID=A0A2T0BJT0_9CLOT|nr:Stk1 family PASTA domain-containing Ser/Thr kinase [Clostridium vincentii]PRR84145.1 Serine/threonine-protein kinase PrkC [Clostridium vincentii]